MDNKFKLQLQNASFKEMIDLWLEVKTRKPGLSDRLPLNKLVEFMGCLESIIRQHEADELLEGIA